MLSFKDVNIQAEGTSGFDLEEFRSIVDTVAATRYVPGRTDENIGSGIKGFTKRVIRKLVWFNIAPVSDKQNNYNMKVSEAISQLLGYIEKQQKIMDEYEKKIELLQTRVDDLEKRKK